MQLLQHRSARCKALILLLQDLPTEPCQITLWRLWHSRHPCHVSCCSPSFDSAGMLHHLLLCWHVSLLCMLLLCSVCVLSGRGGS